jgi:hypothetical protein
VLELTVEAIRENVEMAIAKVTPMIENFDGTPL